MIGPFFKSHCCSRSWVWWGGVMRRWWLFITMDVSISSFETFVSWPSQFCSVGRRWMPRRAMPTLSSYQSVFSFVVTQPFAL